MSGTNGTRPKSGRWRLRPREQRTLLQLGDLLFAVLALVISLYFWGLQDPWLDLSRDFLRTRVDFWFYLLPVIWLLLLVEIHDPHRAASWAKTWRGIVAAATIGLIFFAIVYLFSPKGSLTRWGVGYFLVFAFFFTLLWRYLYIRIFTSPAFMRRVLIVGAGRAGQTLVHAYRRLQPPPFYLAGFVDDDPAKQGQQLEGFPILGDSRRLLELIAEEDISEVVVAITGEMRGDTFQTLLDAQERGVEIVPMPTMYEEMMNRVPIYHLESEWLIRSFVNEARVSGFYELGKRLLDIVVSLIGLFFCALIFPWISLLIWLDSGFPILYRQIRAGKGGRPFYIYKFRTMYQDAEKDGKARLTQENDQRITPVGRFLRRTHIDELPQFLNVLRGEMSVVGPRSERPEWIAEFQAQIPFYRARLLVKPGITGWAQVNYSYYATVEEMAIKLEYDLYYIKHRNLWMDVLLILRTIGQVFGLRGR
jgi:exopolysaccharide biosynthesis polyprenyl glycosylphosphotransferase